MRALQYISQCMTSILGIDREDIGGIATGE